ncbi:MAG: hypothetical protein QN120_04675 [Armatimonadota bacterium]|nr:hypothetical protein [Armatimonadota bacterium]
MVRCRAVLIALMVLWVGGGQPVPSSAAPRRVDLPGVRVLAVAPFYDEWYAPDLVQYGPARLTELLQTGPYRVVPPAVVAEAMTRLGVTARDLISPSRTVELGAMVNADAVLTGRITYALREKPGPREDTNRIADGGAGSRVDVDIRILNIRTRLKPLEEQFSCQLEGSLRAAMDCVVKDAASRLVP